MWPLRERHSDTFRSSSEGLVCCTMASFRYAVRHFPCSPRQPHVASRNFDTTSVYAAKQQHSPQDLTTGVLHRSS